MARRIRHGLDYFPLDTSWDLSMRLLKAQYGLEGLGAIIQLMQMIYREGYYIEWSSETKQLFCAENHIDEAKLNAILEFCIGHGLFDRGLYEQYSVLTSWAIQRQWLRICIDAKRKEATIAPQLNLCPEMNKKFDAQASGITPENSGNPREFSRKLRENSGNPREFSGNHRELSGERKEKKIKEKEKKEKKSTQAEFCQQPTQSAKEIPMLIQSLAKEKRAFPSGPPNDAEPISIKFQKLIRKGKSQ
jgi:hypothetical protein